jgi:predicted  nucleic acid-binding Zn-ribbon protein
MKADMNLQDYISEILVAGGGVATTVTAYVQGKKNAKSTELDNVAKAITIWQDTAKSLQDELSNVQDELKVIRQNHEDCEDSKKRLEQKVEEMDKRICNLGK